MKKKERICFASHMKREGGQRKKGERGMVVTGSKREGGCGSLDKSFKVYSHTQTQIQGNVERTKKTQSTM